MMDRALLTLLFLTLAAPLRADHWAFQAPQRPPLPEVANPGWVRTPVDRFILQRLEKAGLAPSPEADRLTLLRRVTFDLTGLPPTPAEQDAFLRDTSPNAFEKVVDRLLASPHYGERWAGHWLDVVRYAESNGYEADGERTHAWRYRDYVVRSFNDDKPFAQFVTEQVAGDLLASGKDARANADLLIACGLHRCGPVHMVGGNTDPEELRQELLTEMVNGLGSAFLGLTMGCARCHDHKFDPIPQRDYYRLQAFFAGTQYRERDLATAAEKEAHKKALAEIQQKIAPLQAKVASLDGPVRSRLTEHKRGQLEPMYREALSVAADKRTPQQKKLAEHAQILIKVTWDEVLAALSPADRAKRQAWRDEIHALEATKPPPPPQAWTVGESDKAPATHVLKRGDVKQKAAVVEAGVPGVVAAAFETKTPTRRDLAAWLARPDHPLTGRVWVNRLWLHHLGRGLVATPNDFGTRGAKPSHPELLDWLATELHRAGGSTKHLHRLMVLSATYRQSSDYRDTAKADPDNVLLGRMNARRLECESLRDALLASAGTLNRELGGPFVRVPLESAVYDLIFTEGEPDGLWLVTPDAAQHARRTLYLFAKRNVRQPLLEAFDQPDTLSSCPVRAASTFAPQALILMNGPLAREQAEAFALRLMREAGTDALKQIELAYRLALGRSPRQGERQASLAFLAKQADGIRDELRGRRPVHGVSRLPAGIDPATAAALADFALALVNTAEFITIR